MSDIKLSIVTIPWTNPKGEIEHRAQFSLPELFKLTGVPVSTWRTMVRRGDVSPVTGFGKKFYISAEDLLRLMGKKMRKKTDSNPT